MRPAAAAACLALGLAVAACGDGAKPSPGGGPRRIRVATEAAYQPFEYVEKDGSIVGFDIDLVRAAAREAGLEVEFVDQPFDGIIPGLKGGKYDAAVSCITITSDRATQVAFTDPYYDAGQILAVREGENGIRGPADLAGRVVAVQANTTGEIEARKVGAKEVKSFPSIEPAFLDLLQGRADAVINDEPTTRIYLRNHPGMKTAGGVFTVEQYGIAVRKDDPALLAKLNGGLKKVRASGEYDRIKAKWIGSEGSGRGLDAATLLTLLGGLGVSVLLWACALALALAGGLGVALGRLSRRPWLRIPATLYVELVRGVPLLVLIIWAYFVLFTGAFSLDARPSAVLALAVCYSAFIGETYRAGIQSVDPGQAEAARALGMSWGQAMRFVVVPQAVRNVLPALGNESISLLKDTSLASVIAIPELLKRAQEIAGREFNHVEVYSAVALVYLGATLLLGQGQRLLERRFGAGAAHPGPRPR